MHMEPYSYLFMSHIEAFPHLHQKKVERERGKLLHGILDAKTLILLTESDLWMILPIRGYSGCCTSITFTRYHLKPPFLNAFTVLIRRAGYAPLRNIL